RLVQPFETRLPVRLSFHLVTSAQKSRSPKVSKFRQWILQESAYLREPNTSMNSKAMFSPRCQARKE
ncbi:MAG: hypothetical protein O6703_11285, partial [Gammaproteobacteria bacterium]|nr:hypothetical protein [Gammaproteobacteria bacterium]